MKYGNIFYLRIMGELELTFFEKNIQNMYLDVRKYILIEKLSNYLSKLEVFQNVSH